VSDDTGLPFWNQTKYEKKHQIDKWSEEKHHQPKRQAGAAQPLQSHSNTEPHEWQRNGMATIREKFSVGTGQRANSNCPIERYPVVKKFPAAVKDERCDHTIQIMFKGETDGANNEIGLSIPRATRFPKVRRDAISFQSLPTSFLSRSLNAACPECA
jgi:hypothetical protein